MPRGRHRPAQGDALAPHPANDRIGDIDVDREQVRLGEDLARQLFFQAVGNAPGMSGLLRGIGSVMLTGISQPVAAITDGIERGLPRLLAAAQTISGLLALKS